MATHNARETLTAVVIDDNAAHRELICETLAASAGPGLRVEFKTYSAADEALVDLPPEGRVVVICDYRLSGASGIDWLADFIRANVGPIIIVTSCGDEQIAADAFRHGAADYIEKSSVFEDPSRLWNSIIEALRRFKLERTNRDLGRRLKLANSELQRKNAVLAELTDTAHRFVDDVAHEFRTPLAVIKEMATIMTDGIGGEVNERHARYLHFITDASRDLAHLIDDFLDSGKLRARTLRVERREHSLRELVESTWPMLECRATLKRVRLQNDVPIDLPYVFVDADKVRRTLINLVVNAIKFSAKEGVVTVSASADGSGFVELTVTDHGPGLPKEEVQRLFDRFSQGSGANRIETKGFGLGLSIAKELVAINLGTIAVASEFGDGCTFSFTLPESDVESVVDAYLQRTTERAPSERIAIFFARRAAPQASIDELQSFVASVCHPTDIQLAGADGRSTIIIGDTIEHECWRERLLQEDAKDRKRTAANPISPLRVDLVGTWSLDDKSGVREAILDLVRPALKEMRCA